MLIYTDSVNWELDIINWYRFDRGPHVDAIYASAKTSFWDRYWDSKIAEATLYRIVLRTAMVVDSSLLASKNLRWQKCESFIEP